MNKIKFGSYIKEARLKKNYTQQELANLLFVDVSAVSKWERGVSYPDITLVPDICRVLEISEHELIASSHDVEYRKMKKDAKKFNNMKKGTFWTINIFYALAILVCFIVNIAVSHTLSWFYVVLTSIVCAYTFCPTITYLFSKYKNIVFIGSTFISLFLLFLTCSLYSQNYWFIMATLGVLLCYFIVFYPMLFKKRKRYISEEKVNKFSKWFLLTYVLGIAIITFLLLISIYAYYPYNLLLGLLILGGCFFMPIVLGILNLFDTTKNLYKPILIVTGCVVLVLLLAGVIRAGYLRSTLTEKTYVIEETYGDIKIEGKEIDVSIYLSNNNENKVVYRENKKVKVDTKVVNGVLTINQNDERKFYDMLFNFTDFEIDLYLSLDTINSLNIKGSTGDIDVGKGFNFNDVNINNSTGDIEFNSNVNNNLTIVNSTGDVEIENVTIGGNASIKTSTGDIDLSNVNTNKLDIKVTTGDSELDKVIVVEDFNMVGSTGNLKLDGFDAKNIYVSLTTGSVKGTILTEKIIIAKTDTGTIKVPENFSGGKCKITTSTGNIIISYKSNK